MMDGPSAIDPLVAAGPLVPVGPLRPAPSLQRIVMFDHAVTHMMDMSGGNIRAYENGPPVSVPMTSTRFDLTSLDRLQVQLLRDPRPSSVDSTLFSLHLADAGRVVDVRETPDGSLVLDDDRTTPTTAPIGESPAVVIVVSRTSTETSHHVVVSARNAETMRASNLELDVTSLTNAMVTIGGPTAELTGTVGRRRTIPVQIDTTLPQQPIDQVRRAVRGAKRVAGSLRGRIG